MRNDQIAHELTKAGHSCKITPQGVQILTESKSQRLGLSLAGLNIRWGVRLHEQRTTNGVIVRI